MPSHRFAFGALALFGATFAVPAGMPVVGAEAPTPLSAAASCRQDFILFEGTPAGGTVSPADPSHWYFAVPLPADAFVLAPTFATWDVDLYVYDAGCRLVCSSTLGAGLPDACVVPFPDLFGLFVQVRFFSSPNGQAGYVLTRV